MEITPDILAYVIFRVQSSFLLDLAAQYETQASFMRQALRELPLSKEDMKEIERIFVATQEQWSPSWWSTWRQDLQKRIALDEAGLEKLRRDLALVHGRIAQKIPNRRRK